MATTRERTFGQGQILFREGEKGGDLYFLLFGQVELSVRDLSSGESIEIARVEPPAVLGTMTFLEGDDRSATATALTAVKALIVGQEQREELLDTIPDWFKVLVKDLSTNLRITDQEYSMAKVENEELRAEVKRLEKQLRILRML